MFSHILICHLSLRPKYFPQQFDFFKQSCGDTYGITTVFFMNGNDILFFLIATLNMFILFVIYLMMQSVSQTT
jgi:hypothetical protein